MCTHACMQMLGMCLRGFAMQGKFSNLRRNYSGIWAQISRRSEDISDPQVCVSETHMAEVSIAVRHATLTLSIGAADQQAF